MTDTRLKIPHRLYILIGAVGRMLMVLTSYSVFQTNAWYGILVFTLYAGAEYVLSKTQPKTDNGDSQR